MKVTLVVMTLNEIDGMKQIMPLLDPAWCHQILVIDGGSTDGTIEWARAAGYDVHVQRQAGIRHGYLEAWPLVTGDVAVTFSPDGNCPVEAIPRLIAKLDEGYDLVIGSRYLGAAESEDDDIVTAFGNWLFTRTVNLLHRAAYTDAMTIYRAFRRDVPARLGLDREESYRFVERAFSTVISWEPLMSVRAARRGLRVGEIPVDEPPRIGGKRKLKIIRWGAAYYWQFWAEALAPATPRPSVRWPALAVLWPLAVFALYGWYNWPYLADRIERYRAYLRALL